MVETSADSENQDGTQMEASDWPWADAFLSPVSLFLPGSFLFNEYLANWQFLTSLKAMLPFGGTLTMYYVEPRHSAQEGEFQ